MSQLSRFWRKKPVTIEAVQWFKMGDHPEVELYAHGDDKGQEHLGCIKTLESGKTGFHIVSVGDWIIKGVKGEYYACKPDIFALTYEPVDAPASENRTWIPVSERLPDEKGHYLTVVKGVLDGYIVRSQLYKPSAHKAFSGWIHNPVTHWMPLPEAPK